MNGITIEDIRAAMDSDLDATRRVIEATEARVTGLAIKAAFRTGATGDQLSMYREEFAQVGRVAVWEALSRFNGADVDTFFAFIHATVRDRLADAAREELNGAAGVDKDATKTFGAVLRDMADGNVLLAERLCQTELPAGKRLSADRANAARIAWQGSVSIDAPATASNAETGADHGLGETLVAPADVMPKVLAKVGAGAAAEAVRVLHRYTNLVLPKLPSVPEDVDAVADMLTVPRDPEVRRYVLDAVRILRSYVSTATETEVVEDLREVADDLREERAAKHENVTISLARMGAGQRVILLHSFGIGGVHEFGWGDGGELTALAEFLDISYNNAKAQRSKARLAFARYYIAIVATNEDDAAEWAEAAAEMRKQAGRK